MDKSKRVTKELSVGQVANRCGVAVSTIHFYETKGLISCWRNSGNQRRYTRDVLRRIAVIKVTQQLGISLKVIKSALNTLPSQRTPTARDWARMSQSWKRDLDSRISRLEKLRDQLDGCIGCGCLSLKKCPLNNPNDELRSRGTGAVILMSNESLGMQD